MNFKRLTIIIRGFWVCLPLLFGFKNITHFKVLHSDSADSSQINAGKRLFTQQCSSCHNFSKDGIGPHLGGLTTMVKKEWLIDFIKNPQAQITRGDKRAVALFKQFKTYMPSFAHLPDADLNAIIAFMGTQPKPKATYSIAGDLANPIPQKIAMSDLVVNLELVTEIPYSSDQSLHTRIAKMDFHPVTKENFILDLRGKLYRLKNKVPDLYLDMQAQIPKFINQPGLATGFGSFAFHPDFESNGLLYTTHTEAAGSAQADFAYSDSVKVALQWVVSEWKTSEPLSVPFRGVRRELMRINMVNVIHGVQEITFNPLAKKGDADYGLLYIGVGDGGAVEKGHPEIAHNPKKIWGSIVRIDPEGRNSANGRYGIPATNPFSKTSNLGEIYAYGFRNPHRITWTKSGQMLATNIGQKNIESLYLILPGHDYGWPIREGTFLIYPEYDINKVYPLPPNDKKYQISYPVAQFDHDEGNAISGGFEYWGNAIPALKGKYLFGEIVQGRLFYVNVADLKQGKQATIKEWQIAYNGQKTTLEALTNDKRIDLRLGRDHDGELYIFTKPDGKVYKLVR
jgi:mono/diheme cytochrome c family protein